SIINASYPFSLYSFFFYLSGAHRDLHSFPTRRSSDLVILARERPAPLIEVLTTDHARVREALANLPPPRGGCDWPAAVEQACKRSEEHTSELQSRGHLVCRLLLEKKKKIKKAIIRHNY